MTTITMQLPDELVQQAKDAGVLNEQTLSELFGQFLQTRISSTEQSSAEYSTTQETLSVSELIEKMDFKTDKCLTVEDMNAGIGKMFENWKG